MALDHYIPQVHLRQWNSPELATKKFFGVRKRDLHVFPCSSKDVCRVDEGNTNDYLADPRAIEEFLKTVEPAYNQALAVLRTGKTNAEAVYVIAGFTAYIAACSPTAIRLQKPPLESSVDLTTELMEKNGELQPPPEVLGGKTWSELREAGAIQVTIDGKFPQAIGISSVLEFASQFGNGDWELLLNPYASVNPFMTSDFPCCLEQSPDPMIMDRVVPLAPDLAVRIHPNLQSEGEEPDLSFRSHRFRKRVLRHDDVRAINTLVARCSENLIFSRDRSDWLKGFLRKHQNFRVATLIDRIPAGEGAYLLSRVRCVPT
jgi:hypothetical protein